MIGGRSVLAVVPARGGSKGIPQKNITLFHGRPLIEWTAEFIHKLRFLDRSVVSTDSKEIATVARRSGLASPFLRPEHLSGDRISDYDVLLHALEAVEKIDQIRFDIVVMLQPTSPFRQVADVTKVVEKLVTLGLDSVVTVSKTPLSFHPLKQFVLNDGKLEYFDRAGASVIARQDLNPTYFRNGVAYAVTRECLIKQEKVIGENSGLYLIQHEFINIDSVEDIEKGESMAAPQF